jgi:5-methylcytosine-specific restriction endonuclease McrA
MKSKTKDKILKALDNKKHEPSINIKHKSKYPKEFYSAKIDALKVADNRCEICGASSDGSKQNVLHVHHIDINTHNNSMDNLVVLCTVCHMRLHMLTNLCNR